MSRQVKIAIGIATYNRPKMLSKALDSLRIINLPSNSEVILIVVDQENSATRIVSDQKISFPYDLLYFNEQHRGIVYARNRILEEALSQRADYVAFLDDDETTSTNWLVELYKSMTTFNATAVYGTVLFEHSKSETESVSEGSFHGMKRLKDGEKLSVAYTNNVLVDLSFVDKQSLRFHPRLNLTGGEDKLFFLQLVKKGGRIVGSAKAITTEELDESRSSTYWLIKRLYRVGYNNYLIFTLAYGKPKGMLMSFASMISNFYSYLVKPFQTSDQLEIEVSRKKRLAEIKGTFHAMLGRKYEAYREIEGY